MQNNKKVLCLTDAFSLGGAERQLIGLAYYLKSEGYTVDLCSYISRNFYKQLMESYGLHETCLDVKGGKLAKLLAVKKLIKTNKYDCVIIYKDTASFIGCILKFLGLQFKLIVSDRSTNISYRKNDRIKFFLFSFSDYIVTNSFSQRDYIKVHYPNLESKLYTINNFTDTSYFIPDQSLVRNQNTIRILVAARISKSKNIIKFLDVIKLLKESGNKFQVMWFGNISHGEEEYDKLCKNKLVENHLDDVFSFMPATANILSEYQNCDVFCLPSIYEGYPNAICEAMSCGKPIICSRVCDNPLIVEEGENAIMFDPYDTDDMYHAFLRYISLPEEKKLCMGQKSRELAELRFSITTFTQKYINLIDK